jgi:hypothetical protein
MNMDIVQLERQSEFLEGTLLDEKLRSGSAMARDAVRLSFDEEHALADTTAAHTSPRNSQCCGTKAGDPGCGD